MPTVIKTRGPHSSTYKIMAGVRVLKRTCKDDSKMHFMAGAVHKTCSSAMLGGHGADFLRGLLNAISMAHELHEGGGTSGLAAT